MSTKHLQDMQGIPLGANSHYVSHYDKSLLFPIPRAIKRAAIGLNSKTPFTGYDIWNAYEISWLNLKGKPCIAVGEFYIPADSVNIIESKSFKLYLNSFNNTRFHSKHEVLDTLSRDIAQVVEGQPMIDLNEIHDYADMRIKPFSSECIDNLDIDCNYYITNSDLLQTVDKANVSLSLHSNLLKSNCLVTGQPDWGSVEITYAGQEIAKASLLRYLVSFRNHNEFHEQCVERIFMDIYHKFTPSTLTVYVRYTRRGGLDINPIRSTTKITSPRRLNARQARQ